MELGGNFASGWDMRGKANDRASVCDEFINPMYASVPGCTATRGEDDTWEVGFDGARGMMTSVAVGYVVHPLVPLKPSIYFEAPIIHSNLPYKVLRG